MSDAFLRTVSELHPVIHYRDVDTTIANAQIASDAGCCGVFLIQMDGLDQLLDAAVPEIRRRFPHLKIGVNRLSAGPVESIRRNIEIGADSTWCDFCGITSHGVEPVGTLVSRQIAENPQHKLFGSVAFKYQRPEPNPPQAALFAYHAGLIPTTSGSGTGSAPSIDKIRGMAAALPEKILAVASGITPENVDDFIPHVRYFLVSTGISRSFHTFDAKRVATLASKIRGTATQ